ncbi:MAG: Stf0 family sulfotransferase [Pseudomonadota bacterium]
MADRPVQSYIICTAPRSGSTLLCKLLAATNIAGCPASLFHNPSLQAWADEYNVNPAAFATRQAMLARIFQAAKARGQGGTDLFGLRLQRGSAAFFMSQLAVLYPHASTDAGRIKAAFGQTLFIHLSRADKLDQAISYLRAEQTGLWHRHADGTELEQLNPRRKPGYDPAALRSQMEEFSEFDMAWRDWFDAQAITPLQISYETLARTPHQVLHDVLTALGVDASRARDVPVPTAKLADGTSKAWRQRFLGPST